MEFKPKTIWVTLFYGANIPIKATTQEQLLSFIATLDGCMKSAEKKEWKMMYFDSQEAIDGGYHTLSINSSCIMAWCVVDTAETLSEQQIDLQKKMAKAMEKMADEHSSGDDWKKPDAD